MIIRPTKRRKRKGQALVEYALLIAGISVASVVGIAVLGHKVSDQFAVMAAILPGAHADDNNPIRGSRDLMPTIVVNGAIEMNPQAMINGADRMSGLLGAGQGAVLVPD